MVDGVATLPDGLPDLTLGWGVIAHAAEWIVQPNGPRAGQLWTPTLSQARFTLWWYAVDEDGRWLFDHGARRLAKGSGKSPFAALLSLEELVGPVRLHDFDPSVKGGCVGKPVDMPLVQIAATAESQTANTMRMVRAMAQKRSRLVREYGIDVGKTIFYTPTGELQIITSSASAAEGAEVTFAVEDETEHWTPASGGQSLAETIDRNLAKSTSRAIETANAWVPGAMSVAEETYDAWLADLEGRTKEPQRILYDARIAPADTDLGDSDSLRQALTFVYGDCFWVNQETIRSRVHSLRTKPDVARRFYLNQPTASEYAWTTPMAWAALEDKTRQLVDGEDVVLFFDGSKSRDATALIGCCMTDGHVFTVGVWEPDPRHDTEDVVSADVVEYALDRAFDRFRVVAFWGDVREWESYVKTSWPALYGKGLKVHAVVAGKDPQPIAWDMRSHSYEFAIAVELTLDEIEGRKFTHDGDSRVARHVANAHRHPYQKLITVSKETPSSPKKIDAAVCVIGARMVRRAVLGSKGWKKARGNGRVVALN